MFKCSGMNAERELGDYLEEAQRLAYEEYSRILNARTIQALQDSMIYGPGSVRVEVDEGQYRIGVQSPEVQTMLNLDEEKLIPFKTKGKTRDGRECIFLQTRDNFDWPYVWMTLSDDYLRPASKPVFFSTRPNGTAGNYLPETYEDILSISQPWSPRINDEVMVYGYVKQRDHGRPQDADYVSGRVLTVQTNPDDIGRVVLTNNRNDFWECHVRQLKLIRRPR